MVCLFMGPISSSWVALSSSALIRGCMPSLTVSCYAGWGHWEACSILKGNREAVDLGERTGGGYWEEGKEGREGRLCL